MNTSCPSDSVPANALPVPARSGRGLFAWLEPIINTAGFVSVDLTDTIFASMPPDMGTPAEPAVPVLPLTKRPDQSRMLSVHLP